MSNNLVKHNSASVTPSGVLVGVAVGAVAALLLPFWLLLIALVAGVVYGAKKVL